MESLLLEGKFLGPCTGKGLVTGSGGYTYYMTAKTNESDVIIEFPSLNKTFTGKDVFAALNFTIPESGEIGELWAITESTCFIGISAFLQSVLIYVMLKKEAFKKLGDNFRRLSGLSCWMMVRASIWG